YIPDAVPKDGRNLRGKSDDGQGVHAGLSNCRLVPHEGVDNTYDLELMLLMERERRPEEIQVTRPQFTWVEVGTQNERAAPPLTWKLENELDFPSPTYKIRVAKWPALPGEQNVLRSPSHPALTIWWRDSLPRDPQLVKRDVRLTLAK